jgi:hypothetical protein
VLSAYVCFFFFVRVTLHAHFLGEYCFLADKKMVELTVHQPAVVLAEVV